MSTEQDSARRLVEIRERAEKATPGPWENRGGMVGSPGHRAICGMLNVTGSAEMDIRDFPAYANASFIAHSREDVPYLLSLIDGKCRSCDGLGVVGGGLNQEPCTDCLATGIDPHSDRATAERAEARLAEAKASIDSLTAERDETLALNITLAGDIAVWAAEVKRLREGVNKVLLALKAGAYMDGFNGPDGFSSADDAIEWAMVELAALATPPSEGG